MSLLQYIKAAHLDARKARNREQTLSLETLIGELQTAAKNAGNELPEDKVLKIVKKFANGSRENQGYAGDQNRNADWQRFKAEAELYESFLPKEPEQLSDDALHRVIRSIVATRIVIDGSKPKMGVILSDLKILHAGAYDGKKAADLAKAELINIPESI